jgi:PhzF family phenazine biosynthesis protein
MQIFQVDAFTRTPFTGNPASVVLGARGRSDAELMNIAREFSQAETAFVLPPEDPGHDLRLRFFNTRKEAPFVGHATLAAHAVLHSLGLRGKGVMRQLSGTGVVDVGIGPCEGGGLSIEFRQLAPQFGPPLPAADLKRSAAALGVPMAELNSRLPARIARRGSTRLLLPLAGPDSLDAMAPDTEALLALGRDLGADGFFAFAATRGPDALATESRMFCPALGIPEDPVSGNAHAMLAGYLWDEGEVGDLPRRFIGRQGRHVQRPGEVQVALEIVDGRMVAARIAGSAVILAQGSLVI